MNNSKSQLKSGVVLSYINLIIGNVIPLIYTPMMLSLLGQSEYGLYTLANTIVGYLSLLSFGMGSAIVRYITKYKVLGDKEKERQMFGLFTFLFTVLAVIVFVLGIILSFNVHLFYSNTLNASELQTMRILIILCTINSAVTFLFTTYLSMIMIYERYVFRQILNIFTTVAMPCVNIIVLYMGLASVGMVVSSTVLNILVSVASVIYCHRSLHIKPKFKGMPFGELREIFGFCFFVFLGSVVDMLFWSTDKIIIGAVIGTVAVAVYNVGATFNSIVTSLSTTVSSVLVPRVTNMVFSNSSKRNFTDFFIRIGRLQYLVVSLIVSGFIVFGRQFIHLWVGDGYSEAYMVALLTLLPVVIPLIQNTGISIVTAQNKHRFRSVVYLIIAILNVVSTAIAVNYWGIIGAAACSAASYIIGQGFIMNWYYWKKTGIDIPLFWKNILKMSIAPIIMIVFGLMLTRIFSIDSWFLLIAAVIVYIIVFIPFQWFIGMNRYEKDMILKPVKKVFGITNKVFRKIVRK